MARGPLENVSGWQPFEAETDCAVSKDSYEGVPLLLSAGMFVICFPWDAHRPLMVNKDAKAVRKILVKVAAEG